MKVLRLLTLFGCLLIGGPTWAAAPEFDRIFGDHMVLPCEVSVGISGRAEAGRPVKVVFGKQVREAVTDADGRWRVELSPMKPDAQGQSLIAEQGEERTELKNVVVGYVWVASGQSNMEWRLNQTPSGKSEIPQSANPDLRLLDLEPAVEPSGPAYTQKQVDLLNARDYYRGKWSVAAPETTAPCSAMGYYFAKLLQKELKAPVGLIHVSLGGSEMAAWMPESVLKSNKEYPSSLLERQWIDSSFLPSWVRSVASHNVGQLMKKTGKDMPHPFKPAFLYECGIAWMTGFPVHGILWYQGESDAEFNNSQRNKMLLTDLINSWRTAWKNPKLPFVMIELPRINAPGEFRRYWPEFREVQQLVSRSLDNTICVSTIDLGSKNSNVHPPEKLEVANRAARAVLNRVYGRAIEAFGPTLDEAIFENNHVYLTFTHAEGLTTQDGAMPREFEVAGENGKFYPANATLNCSGGRVKVVLECPEVRKPRYARYCWRSFVEPNVVNRAGLPMAPFRTSIDGE